MFNHIKNGFATTKQTVFRDSERIADILFIASVAQLILALLLYMIASTLLSLLLIEGTLAIALSLFSRYKAATRRTPRIVLRIICILYITIPLIISLYMLFNMLISIQHVNGMNDAGTVAFFQSCCWSLLACFLMPILLFLQPVLTVTAQFRRRFDLVFLRIIAIITFVSSIILCIYGLEFKQMEQPFIETSVTYMPVIFGHKTAITIAIDSIFTRVVFCTFSAVIVVFSFVLHPHDKLIKKKAPK